MTYEYTCTACGHQWEAEQRISAKPLEKCPQCGRRTAQRLVSGGQGFILKGGGWYADGYTSHLSAKNGKSAEPTGSRAEQGKSASDKKPESGAGADQASASKQKNGKPGSTSATV
jgi:putative FmdB family regulatory protein